MEIAPFQSGNLQVYYDPNHVSRSCLITGPIEFMPVLPIFNCSSRSAL